MRQIGLIGILTALLIAAPLQGRPATASGSATGPLELSGLERQLVADVSDGQLDQMSLVEASLVAGGVSQPAELARLQERFHDLCRELAEADVANLDAEQRARVLLEMLHRRLLTGQYLSYCSRLDQTLAAGHFNCVTATILYQSLCEQFEIPAEAVAIPGHVFSHVWLHGRVWDVQTTSARWINCRVESNLPVDPAAREINDVELLAKIYYNRGVSLLNQRRFAEAIVALQVSLTMDPRDPSAHQNMLAALNNWSLELCDQGDFTQAAARLEEARRLDPSYPPLHANDLHVHQRWTMDLCGKQQFREALKILEASYQRRPEAELFDRGRLVVYRDWIRTLVRNGQLDEAYAVYREASRLGPSARHLDPRTLSAADGKWPPAVPAESDPDLTRVDP